MSLRVGVIGAGHLGRIHAKLIGQVDGMELVGISDPFQAARARANELFDVPVHADYQEMLSEIDAAVVAAPTDLHFPITKDLLKANKHVLVEKPLADSSTHALQLARIAESRRLTLQVGHVERFNPAFTALEQLGVDVKYVEAVRASSFPGRCLDVGVVMDLMIHDLDLVLSMTDAAVSNVSASGLAVVSDKEDIAETRIEFECGMVANLKASRVSPSPARTMQIYGANGFADIDFGKPSLNVVKTSQQIAQRDFELSQETDNPLGYSETLFAEHLLCESHELQPRNAILDELHDFAISVECGISPTVSGIAGARAVEVADQILVAIEKRRWYSESCPSEIGPRAYSRERIDTPNRTRRARRAA